MFKDRFGTDRLREVIAAFDGGAVVHAGDDVSSADEAKLVVDVPALRAAGGRAHRRRRVARRRGRAVEFVLEGLHLSKRLNKDAVGARATYRGRG